MKKIMPGMVICLLIFSLMACSQPTDQELYYEVQRKLGQLESYSCKAIIYVNSDNTENKYVFLQSFKIPSSYRLEVISPEGLAGNLTISNGKKAWMQHPAINQTWRMDSFEQSQEQMIFIGYFMQNLFNTETSVISRQRLEGKSYIIIETPIPGGNRYFDRQQLWVDTDALEPYQMHIIDQRGIVRFRVYYEDFKYNPQLEDEMFYLKSADE